MYPDIFKSEPLFLPKDEPFGRFRMKGSQFPVDSYDNFVRQVVPRWTTTDDAITKAGGKVEVVDLPKAGIRGNSHMLMMDRNNLEVAALIQRWLEQQGLYQ